MRKRRTERDHRRAREFDVFVAGAGGRLLHTAMLLTGEHETAERLLIGALARTYAGWGGLHGEDPYDRTRHDLVERFARTAWRRRLPRGGVLGRLTRRERLVVVLRLYEGLADEQVAARLGLSVERICTLRLHSVATLRSRPSPPAGRAGEAGGTTGAR